MKENIRKVSLSALRLDWVSESEGGGGVKPEMISLGSSSGGKTRDKNYGVIVR